MDIEWLGGNRFTIRCNGTVLVTEPEPTSEEASDIVTVSRRSERGTGRSQRPFVIDGPGEYEVKDFFVVGVATAIDASDGEADTTTSGGGTIYAITVDGVTVCHAGDSARVPSRSDVDKLGPIDVLLLSPAAGGTSKGDPLSDLLGRLDPSIVVSMEAAEPTDAATADRIAKLVGGNMEAEPEIRSLNVIAGQLPDDTQFIRLARRSADST